MISKAERWGAAPLIVRIGGLPTSAIEPFTSGLCDQEIETCRRLQTKLDEARAEMVAHLHVEIGFTSLSDEERRILLSAKRDCFNGRSLVNHHQASWAVLQERAGTLADRILDLEEKLATAAAELESAYIRERDRERRHLLQASKDEGLIRGLALASRVLVDSLQRKGYDPQDGSSSRAKRLELSLLRYVSRSAVKLSPYSTLTRLGLGIISDTQMNGGLHLQGSSWQESSLLRLKRYVLDQYRAMLLRYPPFRDNLVAKLNSTIEEIGPDRYRFLRPSYWEVDNERGRLRFFTDSVIKVSLSGPLNTWLLNNLKVSQSTYRELVQELESAFAGEVSAGDVHRHIQEMQNLGFLLLVPPWPTNEAHLEKRMLEHLRTLPPEDHLQTFIRDLDRIVALECDYPNATDPVCSVEEIDRLIGSAWKAAVSLGGYSTKIVRGQVMKNNFYEDVFLAPAETRERQREILQISRPVVDDILRNIEPLIRLSAMNSHRHDFVHTMAVFMVQRWPGRREVGFLELFNEVQPLWTSYLQYDAATRRVKGWKSAFNPLSLPCITRLHGLREKIWSELAACVRVEGDESWLQREDLWALVDHLPRHYLPAVGACLFLQSAHADGSLWVLNRISEGVGRFGSRFTPVMEDGMRRHYTDHLAANSVFDLEGKRVELVEILCTQGDTLNVHAPQTSRVLEIPGESSQLADGRKLDLSDLRVLVNRETQLPEMVDGEGQWLLPVHLGGASHIYMPSLVKFICLFGPGEVNPPMPAAHYRQWNELLIRDRMSVGRVVLKRRKWIFPSGTLVRDAAAPSSDCAFFSHLNQWRAKWSIPDRVFFIERVDHEVLKSRFKPQYLDLTSPLMVAMFRSSLKSSTDALVFEEMLPTFEAAPRDECGVRWAVELLLDTIALEPGAVEKPISILSSTVVPVSSTTLGARQNDSLTTSHSGSF